VAQFGGPFHAYSHCLVLMPTTERGVCRRTPSIQLQMNEIMRSTRHRDSAVRCIVC
jgi:hypothetical protein